MNARNTTDYFKSINWSWIKNFVLKGDVIQAAEQARGLLLVKSYGCGLVAMLCIDVRDAYGNTHLATAVAIAANFDAASGKTKHWLWLDGFVKPQP